MICHDSVMTTQTYHLQLRERMIAARKNGRSAQETARWFQVSVRTVERYWKQYQQTGSVEPKQRGGYRRSRLTGHELTLQKWISKQPDLTLKEMQRRCKDVLGIRIGINALWHQLDRLGLSFKKNAARQRAVS